MPMPWALQRETDMDHVVDAVGDAGGLPPDSTPAGRIRAARDRVEFGRSRRSAVRADRERACCVQAGAVRAGECWRRDWPSP